MALSWEDKSVEASREILGLMTQRRGNMPIAFRQIYKDILIYFKMKDNKETVLNLRLKERKELWKEIQSFPKRNITPEQLAKELNELEDKV